jgi:(p)ppGpp synthase/HD superfamily hydrolase
VILSVEFRRGRSVLPEGKIGCHALLRNRKREEEEWKRAREDIGDPYLVHLAEVAAMCASIKPLDPVLVAAAWLHDTLEYTDIDESALRDEFGEAVAALVADVGDLLGSKAKRAASARSTTPPRPASAPSSSSWRTEPRMSRKC